MGTRYTTTTITGFNTSPPPDDNTASEANKVKWATHKDKLADPIKDQVANIDTKLVAMADVGPDAAATNYTTVAGDHQKTIEVTAASVTITLLAVASAPEGYTVTIKNSSGSTADVDATGSETIDGSTSAVTLADNETLVVQLNQAQTGYISLQQVTLTGGAGLNAANVFTQPQTYNGAPPLIFEGATADAFETSVAVEDPTADNTITIPDKTGTIALLDDASKIHSITGTVAASALTAGLGANSLQFRSATLTDGAPTSASFSALSLIVPSGATLGTIDGDQSRLVLLVINNTGTAELAIANAEYYGTLDESLLISTTAIDATADSLTAIYSTTARTDVAFRIVGFIESTQATAGTWATSPTLLQGYGGEAVMRSDITVLGGAATTSGTSHDYTGIPNWAKRVTLMFDNISLSGSSNFRVQIGSGSIEATGYSSVSGLIASASASTTAIDSLGFVIHASGPTNALDGVFTLSHMGENKWKISGSGAFSNVAQVITVGGTKVITAGILDRVRLTTQNGTDTFDSGLFSISYE